MQEIQPANIFTLSIRQTAMYYIYIYVSVCVCGYIRTLLFFLVLLLWNGFSFCHLTYDLVISAFCATMYANLLSSEEVARARVRWYKHIFTTSTPLFYVNCWIFFGTWQDLTHLYIMNGCRKMRFVFVSQTMSGIFRWHAMVAMVAMVHHIIHFATPSTFLSVVAK